jgi:hypothetical protein
MNSSLLKHKKAPIAFTTEVFPKALPIKKGLHSVSATLFCKAIKTGFGE